MFKGECVKTPMPMSENKRNSKTKSKSKKLLASVNTPPITKCFSTQGSKDQSVTSPEYKMSQPRSTRQHSKRQEVETDNDQFHNAVLPCPTPLAKEELLELPQEQQMESLLTTLSSLCSKVTEMDIALNHDTEGINTRITTLQTQQDDATTSINTINAKVMESSTQIQVLQEENAVLKGIVQCYSTQLKTLNDRVAMLTAKSMEKNITISGLTEQGKKENCKQIVLDFLKAEVEIDADLEEILVAHRIGVQKDNDKPRLMIARCKYELKERVFKNISNLKEKTNSDGDAYYINKQLPDKLAEQNREIREIIKEQKDQDRNLQPRDKSKIEVKSKTVYIDGEPVTKQIMPVEIHEMFPEKNEREKQTKMKLAASDASTEEGSVFQGYAYKTGQLHEVKRAYHKVRILHPCTEHVIVAYNLRGSKGFQDDAEYGAGSKLLKNIESNFPLNTAVFVVRMYTGKHLGPKRFQLIIDAADQAAKRLIDGK